LAPAARVRGSEARERFWPSFWRVFGESEEAHKGRVAGGPAEGQQWVDRLEQAQHRNALDDELRRLERYQLLVVDEIGYLPLERQAANLLFALVARRYERGSIIVTSNRGFEAWGEILGDAMVAAALIDRLIHHAHMVTPQGQELPPPRAGHRTRARDSRSGPPALRLNRDTNPKWRTIRFLKLAHYSLPVDSEIQHPSGLSADGETRTRTGDTTIFKAAEPSASNARKCLQLGTVVYACGDAGCLPIHPFGCYLGLL
jgi:hypothetical protein